MSRINMAKTHCESQITRGSRIITIINYTGNNHTVCLGYSASWAWNAMQNLGLLKPRTHWRQSWIQYGRICWKSTKSTVSLWSRTHWQHSRPYRQRSRPSWRQCRPRQAVEFKLLPICCRFRQQSTLSLVCTGLNKYYSFHFKWLINII